MDLVFSNEDERITNAIGFVDCVSDGSHQIIFLLLRETGRSVNVNDWHNSFLGFQFVVFGHAMESANDSDHSVLLSDCSRY